MFVAGDTETITVVTPPPDDIHGDPVGSATTVDVHGCIFAPGPSTENVSNGGTTVIRSNQVDTDATVYAPAGTAVKPTDRILARGVTYEVVGDPLVWANALVEVKLRHVKG